jgi:hypothetical protein
MESIYIEMLVTALDGRHELQHFATDPIKPEISRLQARRIISHRRMLMARTKAIRSVALAWADASVKNLNELAVRPRSRGSIEMSRGHAV